MSALPTVSSLSMLLPFTLLAPIIAMLLIVFLPKEETKTIKMVAAMGMFVSMTLSLYAAFTYDRVLGGMQFTLTIPWIPDLGVNLALGVDGISLPMLLLTNLIGDRKSVV